MVCHYPNERITSNYIIVEQTEPLAGPDSVLSFLEVASKELEVIQSRIPAPEAEIESEESFSESDEIPQSLPIPSAPPKFHPSQPRQRTASVGDGSQHIRRKTLKHEPSANRKGKRRRTEDTLKPSQEPENDHQELDEVRKQKEITENFFYLLYFLAFCSFVFFLFFLFLSSVLFLFFLLFHLS